MDHEDNWNLRVKLIIICYLALGMTKPMKRLTWYIKIAYIDIVSKLMS